MRDLNPSMLLRLRVSSLRDLKRKSLGLSRVTGEKRKSISRKSFNAVCLFFFF